jgi:hypothetical protein
MAPSATTRRRRSAAGYLRRCHHPAEEAVAPVSRPSACRRTPCRTAPTRPRASRLVELPGTPRRALSAAAEVNRRFLDWPPEPPAPLLVAGCSMEPHDPYTRPLPSGRRRRLQGCEPTSPRAVPTCRPARARLLPFHPSRSSTRSLRWRDTQLGTPSCLLPVCPIGSGCATRCIVATADRREEFRSTACCAPAQSTTSCPRAACIAGPEARGRRTDQVQIGSVSDPGGPPLSRRPAGLLDTTCSARWWSGRHLRDRFGLANDGSRRSRGRAPSSLKLIWPRRRVRAEPRRPRSTRAERSRLPVDGRGTEPRRTLDEFLHTAVCAATCPHGPRPGLHEAGARIRRVIVSPHRQPS